MKFVMFIGHHKTGSTALQVYLAENFLKLLREGILYPAVESQGMAQNLASAVAGKDLYVDRQADEKRFNIRVPHNALALRMLNEVIGSGVPKWHGEVPSADEMFLAMRRQIEMLNPETVVIGSEVLSRFADRGFRTLLPRLYGEFGGHDCSVILNLRRPDLHLASWHLQRLKFLHDINPLRDGAHTTYMDSVHFRHDRIVNRWQEAFPEARMVVRNYTDVIAAGGSVQDFFTQSGLDHDPGPQMRLANSSIPYALAEVVRLANRQVPGIARNVVNYVMAAAGRIDCIANSEIELFGEANRRALCDAFAPVHAALNRKLGVQAFFPDMEEARRCNPVPELVAAQEALTALRGDAKLRLPKGPLLEFITHLRLEAEAKA